MGNGPQGGGDPVNLADALLECIACGVIIVSPNDQVLTFDSCAELLTGLPAAAIVGRSVDVFPAALRDVINGTLTAGRPLPDREVRWESGDGKARVLSVSSELAQPAGAARPAVLLKLQNVAQAREMAASLEHLERLANLGMLTADLAHEIKNALVAVRTSVDLALERSDDEMARLVSREVARIDAVVRHVLRDAAREEFKRAPLGVHALLQDAMKLLRHQFQTRSIQAALRLEAASDRISGDERQLRHAFLNLLMNSVEAITGTGRVEVESSIPQTDGRRELCVRISDTGAGIGPQHLPLLFSPFFTTKREGTGLGLAIAHRIVQQHEGRIAVESKLNEGTTFEVFLPLL